LALDGTVGVRELKARLSAWLKRVAAGERVTITDRGKPVALLTPMETTRAVVWAHVLVANGQARWGGGKPAGLAKRVPARGTLASDMVIEDRR
jgi:prevent-host-death family protein